MYTWGAGGYEVSTKGDRRYSALCAKLPDGRTVEEAYQLDVKGYRSQGSDWRLGKGKPPLQSISTQDLYLAYLELWRTWVTADMTRLDELVTLTRATGNRLTDCFAHKRPINQARALSDLLNEYIHEQDTTDSSMKPA